VTTLLQRFGVDIGVRASKRLIEEKLEPILENAIRDGMDDNETLRRLALATRDIPGLRVGAHAAVSTAGAILAEHADDFWPGRTDGLTKRMRFLLKRLGPSLHFASDITADALEKAVKDRTDAVISSSTLPTAERKAELDRGVYVFIHGGTRYVVIPLRDTSGEVIFDTDGDPIPTNKVPFWDDSAYTETITKMEGTGKDRKPVSQRPRKRKLTPLIPIQDAVKMFDTEAVPWGDVEALKAEFRKMAAKPSYFELWGADVWDVIRAYNATLARRSRETGHDWLRNEESEGLAESLADGKVDVTIVRELIGKAFKPRIGQNGAPAGEFTFEAIDELEQVVFDLWAGGEQPRLTKIVRHARRLWRAGAIQGLNPWGVMVTVAGITGVIWMPIVGMVLCLLVAVLLFVQGVFTPIAGTVPFLGVAYDSKTVSMASVVLAGWIAFVVTWFFPIFQTATAWVQTLSSTIKEDWLVSLGRRIVAFGLLFCSGIEFYAIALNVAPIWRVVLLAVAGVGIAVSMGLVEAGYRYKAEELVDRAHKPTLILFGLIPLLLTFTVGVAQGNPAEVSSVWSRLPTFHWWHWAGLGALVLLGIILYWMLFAQSNGETKKSVIGLLATALIAAAVIVGLALVGDYLIQGWDRFMDVFDGQQPSTAATIVEQPRDNGPWFDRHALCANTRTPFDIKKDLNCP
jgi:hypothetical protein